MTRDTDHILIEQLIARLHSSLPQWCDRLRQARQVHLAFMREPYMRYILQGRKTIESRFSRHRVLPYGVVDMGDIIAFKRCGSNAGVIAVAVVASVIELTRAPGGPGWSALIAPWRSQICMSDATLADMASRTYATLIRIEDVQAFESVPYKGQKGDRRPWVVLRAAQGRTQ